MSESKLHAIVSGRVQGVFYRASLAREAQRLGLTGFVKNLPDGRVEYLAMGDSQCVTELKQWSTIGPRMAKVTGLEIVEDIGDEVCSEFLIEY